MQPGLHQFEASVSTEEITTDQGVGFRLFDPEDPSRLDLQTAALIGNNPWKKLEKRFRVPPGTRVVEVRVVRRGSLKFDNKISGTAWIDAVKLRPVGAS